MTTDAIRGENGKPAASTWIFLAILVATGAVGFLVARVNGWLAWLLTLGLMAAVVIAAGYNIKKLYFGFLVDERNRYSLSRLQILLWTMVVLSAYLTAAFLNLHGQAPDPLAIAVPKELWVLMGISVTSLLGSPLILNQRRDEDEEDVTPPPPAGEVAKKETATRKRASAAKKAAKKAAKRAPGEGEDVDVDVDVEEAEDREEPPPTHPPEVRKQDDGLVAQHAYSWKATWSDLFKGELTNNESYLDISRIQLFYFTFILVMVYCFQLFHIFGAATAEDGLVNPIESLPAISGGMLALLGISHTAYLGGKAVPPRKGAGSNKGGDS